MLKPGKSPIDQDKPSKDPQPPLGKLKFPSRFSLRTMTGAFTILTALIAFVATKQAKYHSINEVTSVVNSTNGIIRLDPMEKHPYHRGPILLGHPTQKKSLPYAHRFAISPLGRGIGYYDVYPIVSAKGVSITIGENTGSDVALQEILALNHKITRLDLSNMDVTDEMLDTVNKFPKLVSLKIKSSSLTNHGISKLDNLQELVDLDIECENLDGDCLDSIFSQFPSLKTLDIAWCSNIRGEDLSKIFKYSPLQRNLIRYGLNWNQALEAIPIIDRMIRIEYEDLYYIDKPNDKGKIVNELSTYEPIYTIALRKLQLEERASVYNTTADIKKQVPGLTFNYPSEDSWWQSKY